MVISRECVETNVTARRTQAGPAALSFAQQRLWFFDQMEPESALYSMPVALRLGGALNVPVLQRCLSEVLRRHEILRTRYEAVNGQPAQVIEPAAPLEMPLIDLICQPEPEAEASRFCAGEARRPFDLRHGLMLRASLFRLGATDHILFLNLHHIASDGWSKGLLLRELKTLYEAFMEGKPSPLPELPVQYADFAVWQREWLQGEALEQQLGYWRKQLEGCPAVLEMPTDRPRPARQTYRGALMPWKLPDSLSAALGELSRREGATLFMTLLAAFQTLLHRYTGGEDILVGMPIAGRNRIGIERLIGFFVNTLVLRGDLSGNPSFRTLLGRTREAALGAYDNQDLPFERLVEELHPGRDMSHSLLFQVMFVLESSSNEPTRIANLEVSPMLVDNGTSKFDLTLYVRERGKALEALVEYNTDLFKAETLERMLGHFQTLLEGIVANPEQRLSDLPLLTSAESRQILVEWNQTQATFPKDKCLHQLIEEQAERAPEAVAVIFEDQQMTYRQLNERANQLARHLQGLGVGPDTLAGICVERSPDMVVGLLGILKAGGAYVPLDPDYPRDRVAYVLEHSRAPVLLTQQKLAGNLPAHAAKVVCLDTDWPCIDKAPKDNLPSTAGPGNPAYVIYTSGSTGIPKGVVIEHRGAVNTVLDINRRFHVGRGDRVPAVSSLNFDLSVYDVFGTLAAGATLVLPNSSYVRDPNYWMDLIVSEKVTIWNSAPALMNLVLECAAGRPEWHPPTLRLALLSGDWIPLGLPEQIRALSPQTNVISLGGATEASIWSILFPTQEVAPDWKSIPYGRPMANQQFYVLDKALEPSPVGVRGQLYIGGAGLARGYWRDEERTRASFINHPRTGQRLYRTGDVGRYLCDGNIEFLGREDFQVKIHGFRIELGEIESVLAAHPAVREVMVAVREDVPGDKSLVAYLTAKAAEPPKARQLRELLREKLPEYMLPSAFVILDQFPLTSNGKVDRKALPKPDVQPSADSFAPPGTPTEIALAKLWSEALGRQQIGLNDNFFEIGGQSMQAVRLHAAIRRQFGKAVPLHAIFTAPTILQFARLLDKNANGAAPERNDDSSGNGGGVPLFYIPASDESRFLPRELARHLRGICHCYDGLKCPGLQDGEAAHVSTGEIAAQLAPQILAIMPRGPYYLMSWSSAGARAFEVAHQLKLRGLKVQLVLLLDSVCPGSNPRKLSFVEIASLLRRHLSTMDALRLLALLAIKKLASLPSSMSLEVIRVPGDQLSIADESAVSEVAQNIAACLCRIGQRA